jgi:hypothetical protein
MDPIDKNTTDYSAQSDSADERNVNKKPFAQQRRDERKSNRIPVKPEHQFCELQVESNALSALLVNESQTGFAVLTDRLCDLKAGSKVRLHTSKGWYTVAIVYIREVAPPRDVELSVETLYWLGLKKVRGSIFG